MIQIVPEFLKDVIHWINDMYPDNPFVNLSVLWGYDSIGNEKESGWAAYNPETMSIFISDPYTMAKTLEMPVLDVEDTVIMNLLHEYRHHQQFIHNQIFDEEDAELFAAHMFKEYKALEDPYETPTNSFDDKLHRG